MNFYRFLVVIFLWNIVCGVGYSQDVYYKQYTIVDGLPSMMTYEMVQDSNGVLWIGTEKGLVSFNGEKFTTYTHPDLKDNDIINIVLNKDGHIMFFNLSHQLCKVVDGEIEILFTFKGVRFDLVSSNTKDYVIANETESSRLMLNKIYQLKNNKLNLFAKLQTSSEYNKFGSEHPENSIYYLFEEDSIILYKHKNRLKFNDDNDEVFSLFESVYKKDVTVNNIFVVDVDGKKTVLLPSNQICFVSKNLFNNYDFEDIQRIRIYDNKYYLVLHDRLDVFDPITLKSKVLIKDIIVNTVFQDNENNLWISTRDRGLLKINQLEIDIRSFNNKDQIITGINSIDNYNLILWDDKIEIRNKQFEIVFSYDFNTKKRSIVKNFKNGFYISSGNKFFWIAPLNFTLYQSKHMPQSYKSLEFKNSTLFGGRSNGMVKLANATKMNKEGIELENLKTNNLQNTYALKYSKNQNVLLAGTSKGLYRVDEIDNPFIYVKELTKSNITDIEESIDSSFWVATSTEGIYRIKNEKIIHHYDSSNGLISNLINDLEIQGQYVYAATSNGIAQIDMHTSNVVNKNSYNGLPADYITDVCIFNDSIWLAIQKDIVVIDSTFFSHENLSSVVVMEQFLCNNKILEFRNGMKLDHDKNKIDIILDNISLSSGDNKSIKYRIQSLDTTWTHSKESVIRLPALQPGKYHIEAIGINAVGSESKTENYLFEIKPPWWETLWARLLGLIIFLGIGYFILKFRIKQEKQKRNYITQINHIKDQALQLQMNPHFIFNSLNAIQNFIGTDEEEMAMNYLARFARLIRLIFEHSKGNTITLEEELEFINLYLNLEKLRFKDKIKIHLSIDSEIKSVKDIINVPPLLIQPIIENSFKHGLFHKKGQGNLTIDYTLQNDMLHVTIQDDGIGREAARKISRHNSEKQTSSGINTTLERIQFLNFEEKKNHSRIEIEDLYHEDGSAAGTKTILHLSTRNN